jgi:hypothetical protein
MSDFNFDYDYVSDYDLYGDYDISFGDEEMY